MTNPGEDILQILAALCPGFDVVAFQQVAGGRQWYVPSLRKQTLAELKETIRRDPCRDYKVVARRYHVGKSLVYEAWNERKAG